VAEARFVEGYGQHLFAEGGGDGDSGVSGWHDRFC
jgi:hypothetical protein